MRLLACLICACLLTGCANSFKVIDDQGKVVREIKSHYDSIEYSELPDGTWKVKAGDNRSAWEYIFPAMFQKMPEIAVHTGNEGD